MKAQTEPFVLELAQEFIDPLSPNRSPFTLTRLVLLKEGGLVYPVLRLLAIRKFGRWPADSFPFWLDGDPSNETLDNVALAAREKPIRRKLGLPGGPDYRKRWRALNAARVQKYTREARVRRSLRKSLGS